MIDRFSLAVDLARSLPKLSPGADSQAQKTLNKLIALFVLNLPFESARALGGKSASDLRRALDEIITISELKKLSKLWDAKRYIPTAISHHELASDLVALLDQRRKPFDPTPPLLASARAWDQTSKAQFKESWERFSSPDQLSALLKKWDTKKPAAELPSAEAKVGHAWALLDEVIEPFSPPKAGNKKAKSRAA